MHYSTSYTTPLKRVTLACDRDGEHLVGLWFEGQKYFGGAIAETMVERDGAPLFNNVKNWLDSYFAGERPEISELPLAPIGSAFRQAVWSILCEIPYGETATYGVIAAKMAPRAGADSLSSAIAARMAPQAGADNLSSAIAAKMAPQAGADDIYGGTAGAGRVSARKTGANGSSARAVGGAVGHNPISIIIPCHRVVGSNGNLTGYAGGIDMKIKLLELEGVDLSGFHFPKP